MHAARCQLWLVQGHSGSGNEMTSSTSWDLLWRVITLCSLSDRSKHWLKLAVPLPREPCGGQQVTTQRKKCTLLVLRLVDFAFHSQICIRPCQMSINLYCYNDLDVVARVDVKSPPHHRGLFRRSQAAGEGVWGGTKAHNWISLLLFKADIFFFLLNVRKFYLSTIPLDYMKQIV